MGDNDEREGRRADELDRLPTLFKEWFGVIGLLGGAVAAVLAVLLPQQTSAKVQVIGYAVALALVCVGVFVLIRVRRRQGARERRERRRAAWEREAPGARLAAFRGLLPYQEGDELPGEHRRLEARRLVTQFGEPTFSFGVVCGDSGCGKTSLLRSEIQSSLKAVGEGRGFAVQYLSNPRELSGEAPAGERADAASRLRGELEKLRQMATEAARGLPLILIIDQFEEFFVEYASPELRLEVGRFLDGLIKSSPPVRILCAIRRDYLADMKDLAPADPDAARNFFEPLSLRGLFTLKNFTVEQAARVVTECAERDRIELDEELAATLASDLGEGGSVRPPELQLVCAALLGKMTLAEYRLAGGARGILSHHIEDAIEVSGDADTGRRVLRALCDFPAHAKRNPQTVAEIAEAVGAEGAQSQSHVRTALRRFEGARLVVSEKRGAEKEGRGGDERRGAGETGYALVHDYLVDAVSKATSDVTTRDEEANQMLAYYVSEYREDPKTRVPFRRLRFIRRHADPKQLADPTARRLLRASLTRLVTSTAALAALVVIATTLLVGLITTRRTWHQQILNSHWEGDDSGNVKFLIARKQNLIITGKSDAGTGDGEIFWKYVKFWDRTSAKLVDRVDGDYIRLVKPNYVFSKRDNDDSLGAFHIPTKTKVTLPLLPHDLGLVKNMGRYEAGEAVLSRSGEIIMMGREEKDSFDSLTATVFSTVTNTKSELKVCKAGFGGYGYYITNDGATVIAGCAGFIRDVSHIAYDVRTGKERRLLREGYKAVGSFSVNRIETQVATLEQAPDGRMYIVLWNLKGGDQPERTAELPRSPQRAEGNDFRFWGVRFTQDDALLYVMQGLFIREIYLFRAADLRPVTTKVPEDSFVYLSGSLDIIDDDKARTTVTWPNGPDGGAYVWDLAEAEPRLLKSLTLPEYRTPFNLLTNDSNDRFLIVRGKEGPVELWSLREGRKLFDLVISDRFDDASFTDDGKAVRVNFESGTEALYNSDDGGKIAELQNIGGSQHEIYFDKACRRVNVWTDKGRVLRYTEGWHLFGRESWFWPAVRCAAQ